MRLHKRIALSVFAVLVLLVLLEGCSIAWLAVEHYGFLKAPPRAVELKDEHHCRHDPELGWEHKPDCHIPDLYGPGLDLTINRSGFRGTNEIASPKTPGTERVVLLGDSFTLGWGVHDGDTFAAKLHQLHPSLEVINMGQAGYSVGQCYLWYLREAPALKPDRLVLVLVTDDMWRMRNTRTENGYGRPAFSLRDSVLHVQGQPVPQKLPAGERLVEADERLRFLSDHSALLRMLLSVVSANQGSAALRNEMLEISVYLFEAMQGFAREQGTRFSIALLPEKRDFTDSKAASFYAELRPFLAAFCQQTGIPFLDLTDTIRKEAADDWTAIYSPAHEDHLTVKGNAIVARELAAFLAGPGP